MREVLGATLLSGRQRAAIVTTGHFTRGARQTAAQAVEIGVIQKLELIDIDRFANMLRLMANANKPTWQRALEDKY